MPATYDAIASTTLGSAASQIEFTSISGSYTDLRIVFVYIASSADTVTPYLRFNGDSGANYSLTRLQGNGTTASSSSSGVEAEIYIQNTGYVSTTIPFLATIDIPSYSGSTNKTCLITSSPDRNGAGTVAGIVGLWRDTSAITSIRLFTNSGTFAAGTTATLYGITKA